MTPHRIDPRTETVHTIVYHDPIEALRAAINLIAKLGLLAGIGTMYGTRQDAPLFIQLKGVDHVAIFGACKSDG